MLCSGCSHNLAAKKCCNAQCGACCAGCNHKKHTGKHKNGGSTPEAGTSKEEVVLKTESTSSKRSASDIAQAVTPSPVVKKVKVGDDDAEVKGGMLDRDTHKLICAYGDTDDDEEEVEIKHEDKATKEQAAPSGEYGDKVILSFFQKISDMFGFDEYDDSDGYIEDAIDQYPDLMKATCPEGVNDEWEGMTLFECLCCSQEAASGGRPDARDLMYDLVCRGAVATEKCYAAIIQVGWDRIDLELMLVLVLSGYMPLKSKWSNFTLDEWFGGCDEPESIDEILSVLLGKSDI